MVKSQCFHCHGPGSSLVGELRSHKLQSAAKKNKNLLSCGARLDNWGVLQGVAGVHLESNVSGLGCVSH